MTIEEKIIIDEKLENLSEMQIKEYENYKKLTFKNIDKLFLCGAIFYYIGVPFFYMGFKNIKPREYLTLLGVWISAYPLLFITFLFWMTSTATGVLMGFVTLFLFIVLIIAAIVFYILFLMDVENRVEDYNYECKKKFLNKIDIRKNNGGN